MRSTKSMELWRKMSTEHADLQVNDQKSICAEILAHIEMGVFT